MKCRQFSWAMALLAGSCSQVWAQEAVDNPGRVLASNCFQCHGTDGTGVRGGIEGIADESIIGEMREFARRRATGEEGIMVIHAQAYTADEVQWIADYLAGVCTVGDCADDGDDDDRPEIRPVQVALHISSTRLGDVLSDEGALTCVGRCNEIQTELEAGRQVTLTAVPREGRRFRGWRGDCGGRNPVCVLTLSEEREVTARFSRR